jgi:acyl-[acyl-carrier-protein]-phospholipid O-acyltransferase / long-chain-fatty-acid--[acyl-carrier-protein] ligase
VLEDIQRNPASYDRLVMGSFILGRRIAELTPGQKNVGVLLPNATGCFVTLFGLHAFGRVPAMLNFSTGCREHGGRLCTAAQVSTIVTSRRFIEAGNMEEDVKLLSSPEDHLSRGPARGPQAE